MTHASYVSHLMLTDRKGNVVKEVWQVMRLVERQYMGYGIWKNYRSYANRWSAFRGLQRLKNKEAKSR